ncbi:MAG: hypothetical protein BZ136_07535 [Methanosphaera sp. rholeuAM74]|nr:MAG: hypothetical protein BZ136_07535 [Methanosphaera sp. rholeuAM74]
MVNQNRKVFYETQLSQNNHAYQYIMQPTIPGRHTIDLKDENNTSVLSQSYCYNASITLIIDYDNSIYVGERSQLNITAKYNDQTTPASNITLRLSYTKNGSNVQLDATTDSNGQCTINTQVFDTSGTYTLQIAAVNLPQCITMGNVNKALTVSKKDVFINDNSSTTTVNPWETATISCIVTDPQGNPVSGAKLNCSSGNVINRNVTTNSNGIASFTYDPGNGCTNCNLNYTWSIASNENKYQSLGLNKTLHVNSKLTPSIILLAYETNFNINTKTWSISYFFQLIGEDNSPLPYEELEVVDPSGQTHTLTASVYGHQVWWKYTYDGINSAGVVDVTVRNVETSQYKQVSTSISEEISKENTTITSVDAMGYCTRNVGISATLKHTASNTALSGKTLKLMEGNTVLEQGTTDINGTVTFNHTFSTVGTKNLNIKFAGDTVFAASNTGIHVNILPRKNTILTFQYNDNIYGYNMGGSVHLYDENNETLSNEYIKVYDETNTLIAGGNTDSNGEFTFSYLVQHVGVYQWKIVYEGSDPYIEHTLEVNVTFIKDTPILSIISDKSVYTDGSGGYLTMILTDSLGRPLGSKNLKVTNFEAEKLAIVTTNQNGESRYDFEAIAGYRQFNVEFFEDEHYNYVKEHYVILYNIVVEREININNCGAELAINPSLVPIGLYDVEMNYLGTVNYGVSENNQGIDVKKATYFELISPASPIRVESMSIVNVTSRLCDTENHVLPSKNVTTKINNTISVNSVTNENGLVSRSYPVVPSNSSEKRQLAMRAPSWVGTITILSFIFGFTHYYASCRLDVPIEWTKITPTLDVEVPAYFFCDVADTIHARLYYTCFDEEIPITGKNITLDCEGISVTAVTDSNGEISIVYNGLSSKTVSASMEFAGDSKFNSVFEDVTLNILDRLNPRILCEDESCSYGDDVSLDVTFVDDRNNPLAGQTLTFYEDGQVFDIKQTDNNGRCSVDYPTSVVGEHHVTIVYTRLSGVSRYNSCSKDVTINVGKATPTLTLNIREVTGQDMSFKYGKPLTAEVSITHKGEVVKLNSLISLKYSYDGTNSLTLFNERLNNGTLEKQFDSLTPNINNVEVFARFGGSSTFNGVDSNSVSFQVVKLPTYIVPLQQEEYNPVYLQRYSGKYAEKLPIYATLFYKDYTGELKPLTNKALTCSINGGVTATTNSNGIATFKPVLNVAPNTYKYDLSYEGNAIYNNATLEKSVQVQVEKGTIQLQLGLVDKTQQVYAMTKKTSANDEKGFHYKVTAKDYQGDTITNIPSDAPLNCVISDGILYTLEGEFSQRETFSIPSFPYTFYASSGQTYNVNDNGTKNVTLQFYSNKYYNAAVSNELPVTLRERDSNLTYILKSNNKELPKVNGVYVVTLPETILLEGLLQYNLAPTDIGYSNSNRIAYITGENYSRQWLDEYELLYNQAYEEDTTPNKSEVGNIFKRKLTNSSIIHLSGDIPVNIIRLAKHMLTEDVEDETGVQLAVVDGHFSYNWNVKELNPTGFNNAGEEHQTFYSIVYSNQQNFQVKGASYNHIGLQVNYAQYYIKITEKTNSTVKGKLYYINSNGDRILMGSSSNGKKPIHLLNTAQNGSHTRIASSSLVNGEFSFTGLTGNQTLIECEADVGDGKYYSGVTMSIPNPE